VWEISSVFVMYTSQYFLIVYISLGNKMVHILYFSLLE